MISVIRISFVHNAVPTSFPRTHDFRTRCTKITLNTINLSNVKCQSLKLDPSYCNKILKFRFLLLILNEK